MVMHDQRGRRLRPMPMMLLVLITAWLVWPALFSQHLEGYTATLEAIALTSGWHGLGQQDALYPVLTEFLYYTRLGIVAMLEGIYGLFGSVGDHAFRAIMIGSLILILVSCVTVARRLQGVPAWAALLALLLAPGVTEGGFLFNDNLPSAAFVSAALAVAAWRSALASYAAAGALIGVGILIRLDAAALAPFIGCVALLQTQSWRAAAMRVGAAVAGTFAVLLIAKLLLGGTPLDAMLVSRGFVPVHDIRTTFVCAGLFFGVAGGGALAIGYAIALARPMPGLHPRLTRLIWAGYPVLLGLIALKLSAEVRYIFPLFAPFVAALGGRALAALASGVERRSLAALAAAALVLGTTVAPPKIYVLDGPHAMWGRLWMPFFWSRWQDRVANNLAVVDRLVAGAEARKLTLIVNSQFNDEMFLKQRLLAAGYAVKNVQDVFPGCSAFSVYSRDGHVVAQVRTDNQYRLAATAPRRFSALMLHQALGCPALARADAAFVTNYGDTTRMLVTETAAPALWGPVWHHFPPELTMSDAFTAASITRFEPWRPERATSDQPHRLWEGKLSAYPVSRQDLQALRASAELYLKRPYAGPVDGPASLNGVRQTFASRCKHWGGPGEAGVMPLCLRH
jgi:hypothetical protein